jgi:hypothetical protein
MSKKLGWVTNVEAKPETIKMGNGVISIQEQIEWRSQFVQGDPQSTKSDSVASLKAMGVIGLYKQVEE